MGLSLRFVLFILFGLLQMAPLWADSICTPTALEQSLSNALKRNDFLSPAKGEGNSSHAHESGRRTIPESQRGPRAVSAPKNATLPNPVVQHTDPIPLTTAKAPPPFQPITVLIPPHQLESGGIILPTDTFDVPTSPEINALYRPGDMLSEAEFASYLQTPEVRTPERVVTYDFSEDENFRPVRQPGLARRLAQAMMQKLRRTVPTEINIPPKPLGIDSVSFRNEHPFFRLQEAVPGIKNVRHLTDGGQSRVFTAEAPGFIRRVFKVLLPDGNTCKAPRKCVQGLIRAVALMPLAQTAANAARLFGKRFIEVVPIEFTPEMLSQGVIAQAFSPGPTSAALTNLWNRWYTSTPNSAERQQYTAQLLEFGIDDPAAFRANIRALSQFYADIHAPAKRLLSSRGLDVFGSYVWEPTPGRELIWQLGLDFNHGYNVIWNVERKIFQIIDW